MHRLFITNNTNLFVFESINNSTPVIKSTVSSFAFSACNLQVDNTLVHPTLFAQIESLTIETWIRSIEADVFKPFAFLRAVTFAVSCLKNFFHEIGTGWAARLANHTTVFFIESTLETWYNPGAYTYPDSDLCLTGGD